MKLDDNNETPQVFISHSSKDKLYVELFDNALSTMSIKPWIDHAYLKGGDKFPSTIIEAITNTDILILLWSQNAASSPWVTKEYTYALSQDIRLIPQGLFIV